MSNDLIKLMVARDVEIEAAEEAYAEGMRQAGKGYEDAALPVIQNLDSLCLPYHNIYIQALGSIEAIHWCTDVERRKAINAAADEYQEGTKEFNAAAKEKLDKPSATLAIEENNATDAYNAERERIKLKYGNLDIEG